MNLAEDCDREVAGKSPAGLENFVPGEAVAQTPQRDGSWCPQWQAWLVENSTQLTTLTAMGAPEHGYAPLCDRPPRQA